MRKVFFIIIIIILFTSIISNANTSSKIMNRSYKVYIQMDNPKDWNTMSGMHLKVGNETVLCINPHIDFKENIKYKKVNAEGKINKKILDRIAKIAYVTYKKNKTFENIWLAQLMTWEELGFKNHPRAPKPKGFSKSYDFLKKDVIKKIKRLDTLPSFNNKTYNITNIEKKDLKDLNKVLKDMYIKEVKGDIKVNVKSNALNIIKGKNFSKGEVVLRKIRNNDMGSSFIFNSVNSQPLIITKMLNPIETKIKFYSKTKQKEEYLIRIKKVDQFGENLIGVKIGLFDLNNKLIKELITTRNSNLFKVKEGSYFVKEIETLRGYIKSNKKYKVKMDSSNKIEDITFVNKKILGEIKLLKKDKDNNLLKNVEYELYDKNKKLLKTYKTNEKGILKIKDLLLDKYYLKETKTNKGYILDDKMHEINLTEKNNKVKLEKINKYTKLKIIKVDEDGKNLKGASFELYHENKLIASWTGSFKEFKRLPLGNYTLKEINAPKGYIKSKDINFNLSDEKTKKIYVKNFKENFPRTGHNSSIYLTILGILSISTGFIFKP